MGTKSIEDKVAKPVYRSVFVSDVHLGTKGCKAKKLHKFLDTFEAENLFLVGDIIDGWALRRRHYWTKSQTEVIRKVLKLSEKMNVFYIAGNHDDFIRPFFKYDFQFGSCQILDSYDYSALDGRRILVTHGDHYDLTMKIPRQLINVFGHVYDKLGSNPDKSFFDYLFDRIGTEPTVRKKIKMSNYDAAICGHTHTPKIVDDYMNCGDWTHNCTALVEHLDGRWELLFTNNQDDQKIQLEKDL